MDKDKYIKIRKDNLNNLLQVLYLIYNEKHPTPAMAFYKFFRLWIEPIRDPFSQVDVFKEAVNDIVHQKDKEYNITIMYNNKQEIIDLW